MSRSEQKAKKAKFKCTPGCPNKFDETCCRSRGESPDLIPTIEKSIDVMLDTAAAEVQIPRSKLGLDQSKNAEEARAFLDTLTHVDVANGKGLDALGLLYGVDLKPVRAFGLLNDPLANRPKDTVGHRPTFVVEAKKSVARRRTSKEGYATGTIVIHDPVTVEQVKGSGGLEYSIGYRTQTETGRRCCERVGCYRPAVREKGVAKWTRLCAYHNEKRTEAIQQSRSRPDCACGNKLPRLGDKCSRCANKVAAERIEKGAEGANVDIIKRDIRELVNLALKGEIGYIQGQKAMKQILQNVEKFREDGPKPDVPKAEE